MHAAYSPSVCLPHIFTDSEECWQSERIVYIWWRRQGLKTSSCQHQQGMQHASQGEATQRKAAKATGTTDVPAATTSDPAQAARNDSKSATYATVVSTRSSCGNNPTTSIPQAEPGCAIVAPGQPAESHYSSVHKTAQQKSAAKSGTDIEPQICPKVGPTLVFGLSCLMLLPIMPSVCSSENLTHTFSEAASMYLGCHSYQLPCTLHNGSMMWTALHRSSMPGRQAPREW